MRTALTILILILVVAGAILYFGNEAAAPTTAPVTLYYYEPAKDTDESGNILCSARGLVGVQREIPASETVIEDTIRLLLRGELTEGERTAGIMTEFPLEGVSLTSAVLQDGTLTLTFADPLNKTGGGSCRVAILWAQIAATAQQFPLVQAVRFAPEELFQP